MSSATPQLPTRGPLDRRDGTPGFTGVPQPVLWALADPGYFESLTEFSALALILFHQFQFEPDKGKPQPIKITEFIERGMSRASAFRALARLESAGIIRRIPGVGRGHPTQYAVGDAALWRKSPARRTVPKGSHARDPKRPAAGTLSGRKGPTLQLAQSGHKPRRLQPAPTSEIQAPSSPVSSVPTSSTPRQTGQRKRRKKEYDSLANLGEGFNGEQGAAVSRRGDG